MSIIVFNETFPIIDKNRSTDNTNTELFTNALIIFFLKSAIVVSNKKNSAMADNHCLFFNS
jgi:hypothetical protein